MAFPSAGAALVPPRTIKLVRCHVTRFATPDNGELVFSLKSIKAGVLALVQSVPRHDDRAASSYRPLHMKLLSPRSGDESQEEDIPRIRCQQDRRDCHRRPRASAGRLGACRRPLSWRRVRHRGEFGLTPWLRGFRRYQPAPTRMRTAANVSEPNSRKTAAQ